MHTHYRRVASVAHPWMTCYFHYIVETLTRVTPLLPELRQFENQNLKSSGLRLHVVASEKDLSKGFIGGFLDFLQV